MERRTRDSYVQAKIMNELVVGERKWSVKGRVDEGGERECVCARERVCVSV